MPSPTPPSPSFRGRGAAHNPTNRFVRLDVLPDDEHRTDPPEADPAPTTEFLKDSSRTAIAYNDSPDVGFTASINPYRGCEHGCIYCYARPTHEYLSLSAGLDFETKILVKSDAPKLLREELSARKWKPQTISLSGVTDCYQPVERRLRLTRQCIEVLREFRNPLAVITKNHLVTRDIDLLSEMAAMNLAVAFISVTTLDPELSAKMEPRTASPNRRLDAIRQLTAAGVPVGVMVAPCIPGLTDHEIPTILSAARDAGAVTAGFVPVRLPGAVAPLFEDWLTRHFPDRKDKVLNRIRSLRDGRLNDPNFTTRMQGSGPWSAQLHGLFDLARNRNGLNDRKIELTTAHFRVPGTHTQLGLFPTPETP